MQTGDLNPLSVCVCVCVHVRIWIRHVHTHGALSFSRQFIKYTLSNAPPDSNELHYYAKRFTATNHDIQELQFVTEYCYGKL